VPILDYREAFKQLTPLGILFDGGKRSVQIRGIALVAVMFIPRLVGHKGLGGHA
jgi:hypothetical protein